MIIGPVFILTLLSQVYCTNKQSSSKASAGKRDLCEIYSYVDSNLFDGKDCFLAYLKSSPNAEALHEIIGQFEERRGKVSNDLMCPEADRKDDIEWPSLHFLPKEQDKVIQDYFMEAIDCIEMLKDNHFSSSKRLSSEAASNSILREGNEVYSLYHDFSESLILMAERLGICRGNGTENSKQHQHSQSVNEAAETKADHHLAELKNESGDFLKSDDEKSNESAPIDEQVRTESMNESEAEVEVEDSLDERSVEIEPSNSSTRNVAAKESPKINDDQIANAERTINNLKNLRSILNHKNYQESLTKFKNGLPEKSKFEEEAAARKIINDLKDLRSILDHENYREGLKEFAKRLTARKKSDNRNRLERNGKPDEDVISKPQNQKGNNDPSFWKKTWDSAKNFWNFG